VNLTRTFVIAEAGVNHNGSAEFAERLVDAAAAAGADAVKFQTFKAERLLTHEAPKAQYQTRTTDPAETQYEMIRSLELTPSMHRELSERCKQRGLRFLSTPFDEASLDFLVDEIGLDTIKLPSGEVTNAAFLLHAARRARKIILSTGMSTLDECRGALAVIAFGMQNQTGYPKGDGSERVMLDDPACQSMLRDRVILLHCTTEYPAAFADVNLAAIDTMRDAFGVTVGLSDHTPGISIAIGAVARGARVIEKHFTLDRSLPGPDHAASLLPQELGDMIAGIRAVEASIGDGIKAPVKAEMQNRTVVRKSIVAARNIVKGESFDATNLTAKRPANGRSPMEIWSLFGKTADRDYRADEPI
jgi:N-acetylneuraminate synthase